MKVSKEKNDVEKVKKYLLELGFACNSNSSAQQLIYSKNNEVILIKNNR